MVIFLQDFHVISLEYESNSKDRVGNVIPIILKGVVNMRSYGAIQTSFWGNVEAQQLSDQAKLLIAYLLTGPHTTMLGCFRLPKGYIESDLQWERDKSESALSELSRNNFVSYDDSSGWLLIQNFLRFNPICNPRQGVCIQRLFSVVPPHLALWKPLINSLLTHGKHLLSTFTDHLKTLQDSGDTVKKEDVTDQEQEEEQEQEQNKKKEELEEKNLMIEKESKSTYAMQALEVLNFLNNKTGCSYRPVDNNLKWIIGRLHAGASVKDCCQVIAKKTREWHANPKMAEFLRPATLFHPSKFDQYVGQLIVPQEVAQHG
ncbi:MAG: hypothetical protein K0S27_1385 [Gammaproteobacteria bacterium]|nr:hypothetical protein [Gammaproteobacteria bacterium]